MKKIVAFMMLVAMLSPLSAFAGEEGSYEKTEAPKSMEDREVIYHDFDLELELEDGVVSADWDEFDIDGFDWFKLVYSQSETNPVYPTAYTMFIGSKDQTEAEFRLKSGGMKHYVRLCAVVLNDDYSKDRYCGATQLIEGDAVDQYKEEYKEKKEEYKEEKKEEYKKEEYKKDVKTVATKQKDIEEAKKMYLPKSIKTRIDNLLENFITGLGDKGYSDTKIVETIDIVLERLEAYEGNDKYAAIVGYMKRVLEEYRTEFNSGLGDLDGIFSDL